MNRITRLNDDYINNNKRYEEVKSYIENLRKLNDQVNDIPRIEFVRSIKETAESEVWDKNSVSPMFGDLCSVINSDFDYLSAINQYELLLFEALDGGVEKNEQSIALYTEELKKQQSKLSESISLFENKYQYRITSTVDINLLFLKILDSELKNIQLKKQDIISAAKFELEKKVSTKLFKDSKSVEGDKLPEEILIARTPTKSKPCVLLQDIGIRSEYENIEIDVRNQGNVIVETNYENTLDKEMDSFVLAYVFRFIESFPLGMVNVHVFDKNPNIYNQRLNNLFKDGSYSERAKRTFSLYNYNSLSQLKEVASIITDDILKKTSYEYPDLYSIHEIDKTNTFNLFVLRDGLLDQGGHSVSSVLDMINSLTKPKDTGHVCGIRFLIIDDSTSNAKNLSESTDYLIRAIKSNCAVHLNYDNKRFMYNGKEIEVVHIDDDLNEFIQHRATKLAQDISNLEKQFVSLNEVVSTDIKDPDESIYRIPVGKSGNSVVEIPLSCKDDNGTVDGQCIGYLVIGSSGSGKSSFFHSVVINGCLHYSPAALQFWLLDFKYGGASSKYRKSQIPHVRIVAENNKIDDALCLFQMIFDEMERRNKLINKMSVDNIVEYNSCVEDSKRLPRIIVMIDEVQEIFRDDNAAELQRMIASISVRMRSVGMHFIMVAQNLSEGKSYMLKDAFMPSESDFGKFRF